MAQVQRWMRSAAWRRPWLASGAGKWTIQSHAESTTSVVGVDPARRSARTRSGEAAGCRPRAISSFRVDDLFTSRPDRDFMTWFFLRFWLAHVRRPTPTVLAQRSRRASPRGRFLPHRCRTRVGGRNIHSRFHDCPYAGALVSWGGWRTVRSFGLSSVRSIPIGSRQLFVNTASIRLCRDSHVFRCTGSADVPSPTSTPSACRHHFSRLRHQGTSSSAN